MTGGRRLPLQALLLSLHASSHLQLIYHFLTGGDSPYGLPPASPVASSSPGLASFDMLIRIYSLSNISGQVCTLCPRHPALRQRRWLKALFFFQRIFVSSSCFVDRSAGQPIRTCASFGDTRRLSSSNSISLLLSFAPFALDRFADAALGAGDAAAGYAAPSCRQFWKKKPPQKKRDWSVRGNFGGKIRYGKKTKKLERKRCVFSLLFSNCFENSSLLCLVQAIKNWGVRGASNRFYF